MTDKDAILQSAGVPIYTVVHTAVDADHGEFPDPVNFGSFLSYDKAKDVMASLIETEKEKLSSRYDTVESDENAWEAYEDGYAAARFTRFEILASELHINDSCTVTERCQHCESEIMMRWSVEELGYRAYCPVCGEPLMLCDECRHTGEKGCDYDSEARSCMRGSTTAQKGCDMEQKECNALSYIRGEYVITGLSNVFNRKTSWWISKAGYTLAVYCFSANAQREVDEQLAVFDRYIDLFESCMVRLAAGAKQEVHCA